MNTMGAIHAALRARDIDKEDARERFERVTGKRSLKAMSEAQRHKVLDDLNADGRKPASNGSRKLLTGPYAKKLQALWIAGWNLGLVRNRDDKALLAFVKRQTDLEHTQFLHDAENAAKVIEALKGWLAREGGVDWSIDKIMPDQKRLSGYKIAKAQIERLYPDADAIERQRHLIDAATAFSGQLKMLLGAGEFYPGLMPTLPEERDWIPVMNGLGRQVRNKQKAAG